jgi:20S proteasome subunit beta 2
MAVADTDSTANGFDFSNHLRNSYLTSASGPSKLSLPKATSTGTTIVGLVWEGGICLGADTRATEGPIVADKKFVFLLSVPSSLNVIKESIE